MTCPGNSVWDGNSNSCVCRSNLSWIGNQCACPSNSIWNGNECVCPGNSNWDGKKCVCPTSTHWNGSNCAECTGGRIWDGKQCACPTNTHWTGASCQECTGGRNWDTSRKACVCPNGRFWTGLSCAPPPPRAPYAGFDCSTATTDVEKIICGSPTLSILDWQLNKAYDAALRGPNAALVRKQQREWIKIRSSCTTEECLISTYRTRLNKLDPAFRPYSHGYIGGKDELFNEYAFNVPLSIPEERKREVRAEVEKRFYQNLELKGIRDKFLDPKDYDFMIGVALTGQFAEHLDLARVVGDQLSRGLATPLMQSQYETLRGRTFEVLDCHSNGAMICLHAITNHDIKAARIRLMGPQLTPGALRQWQDLIERGEVQGVEIYLSDRDPVPIASFYHTLTPILSAYLGEDIGPDLFDPLFVKKELPSMIKVGAPSVSVLFAPIECKEEPERMYSRKCHEATFLQPLIRE